MTKKNGGLLLFSMIIVACFVCFNSCCRVTARLDRYVRSHVNQGLFSGAVLVAKDGKILLSKAYAMANYELCVPNKVHTKFGIASLTKSFTALAIMQLQEMGLLNVQAPLSTYISDYPNGASITIHHLLTHTSGIKHVIGPTYSKDRVRAYSIEERIELFKNESLAFNPGEKYLYSNNNYILLTYIIEKVSGTTYESFLQNYIFNPLCMNDSGCADNKKIICDNAAGYTIDLFEELVNADYLDMSFERGAGMIYSTIQDLYRWDRALYTDKLVSKKLLAKIFTADKGLYGYGWHVDFTDQGKVVFHEGGNPGISSILVRNVDKDMCIIVLSNFQHSNVKQIADDLQLITLGKRALNIPKKPKEISLNPMQYDQYVGEYRVQEGDMHFIVTKEKNKLFVEVVGVKKYLLHPQSLAKFFLKFESGSISFSKDKEKGVMAMTVHQVDQNIVAEKVD